ncbi:tripartite tricarboxylate transporter TctB family protein [Truepera radiovictrix]|uniref:Tricarboxylic transport membrane protein n=1 Tax=Truepera radiovictrix (strain DSM 17093 / CIP 108686 / LMG 22925 / RQ-24) TaxID=649638 RepID=D7CXE5_TRURR|nr:tripartite tricarboxylate transporter TctB family protein [Truepera radiovictrix]ADI13269.1 putative tricarboxylic transport membrane protein [Truepera radiovictrix DSM 17093]WMT58167.1 tripartite tricarboxylate transporter TctB family protein [Truepera radiovictrix]
MSDRVAALLLLLLALFFGLEALSYRAGDFTDALGARAFPLAVTALLVPSALYLLLRPQPDKPWPPAPVWGVLGVAVATFIAYALLLEPLGFIFATTLFFVVFGAFFAAPWWRSALAGLAFSAALYAIFVWALDLYLPVGGLFERFI